MNSRSIITLLNVFGLLFALDLNVVVYFRVFSVVVLLEDHAILVVICYYYGIISNFNYFIPFLGWLLFFNMLRFLLLTFHIFGLWLLNLCILNIFTLLGILNHILFALSDESIDLLLQKNKNLIIFLGG